MRIGNGRKMGKKNRFRLKKTTIKPETLNSYDT